MSLVFLQKKLLSIKRNHFTKFYNQLNRVFLKKLPLRMVLNSSYTALLSTIFTSNQLVTSKKEWED